MPNGAAAGGRRLEAVPPPRVAFRRLRRVTNHRTSAPTDEAIRDQVWQLMQRLGGGKKNVPYTDAVILAAVRIASRDDSPCKLQDEALRIIESELFELDEDLPHEPGE